MSEAKSDRINSIDAFLVRNGVVRINRRHNLVILAINIDPEANMVTKAGYAVLGDLHEVVPAVVEEMDSTTLVHPGYKVSVDPFGNLIIEHIERSL